MSTPSTGIRDGIPALPDLSTLPPDGGAEFNRLVFTSSPYLLQHARNPVDWYPWGDEAFEKALREDKPVFLSIGYSTCHWCHVMEHESFEDPDAAAYLNEHFVSIKVDREERPDIDHIYMTVCQAMTGSGGWPLTILMTPWKKPFYAGTYFPKHDRFGRPGLLRVLEYFAGLWRDERDKLLRTGEDVERHLAVSILAEGDALDASVFDRAVGELSQSYDPVHGGFGGAPKFPMPHALGLLLRRFERDRIPELLDMVEHTLVMMHRGGMYDHVGFGFCRYSTDARWLVPHFEKMLYDNALLLMAYTDTFQATGKPAYATVARQIVAYTLRDMTGPEGAFYSAENADSEGKEGKFYVFTRDEFLAAIGSSSGEERGEALTEYFGVESAGNFEAGKNILHIAPDPEEWLKRHDLTPGEGTRIIEEAREKLFAARAARVHPSLDDKILASWNGLMIAALARAGRVLRDGGFIDAACRAADRLLDCLLDSDGRLLHRLRNGVAGIGGFLDDYAFFALGLIELYESSFDVRYLSHAVSLARRMIADFRDDAGGAFFYTAHDAEPLITRTKEVYDGALPSGNSAAAFVLVRLARMTGDGEFERLADEVFRTFAGEARRAPGAHAFLLSAYDFACGPVREIVLAAERLEAIAPLAEVVHRSWLPRSVVLFHPSGPEGAEIRRIAPFTAGCQPLDGRPTAYVCENFACSLPVTDAESLQALLANTNSG